MKVSKKTKLLGVIAVGMLGLAMLVGALSYATGGLKTKADTAVGRVSGSVTGTSVCPKAGSLIELGKSDGDENGLYSRYKTKLTDANGKFDFGYVPAGYYYLLDYGRTCGGTFTAFNQTLSAGRCEPKPQESEVWFYLSPNQSYVNNFTHVALSTVPVKVTEVDTACASSGGVQCAGPSFRTKIFTSYMDYVSAYTGNTGTGSVHVPAGPWTVTAIKDGFSSDSKDITVPEACKPGPTVGLQIKSL